MALKIKELRKLKGLTQEQLAAMAGVSRSQLSEIESESKPANTLRLQSIASSLGVQIDQLFDEGSRDRYKDELSSLLDLMEQEDRDAIMRTARAMAYKR
jgi:transcriptional regulator with XRE-family HTH domain